MVIKKEKRRGKEKQPHNYCDNIGKKGIVISLQSHQLYKLYELDYSHLL